MIIHSPFQHWTAGVASIESTVSVWRCRTSERLHEFGLCLWEFVLVLLNRTIKAQTLMYEYVCFKLKCLICTMFIINHTEDLDRHFISGWIFCILQMFSRVWFINHMYQYQICCMMQCIWCRYFVVSFSWTYNVKYVDYY